MKIKIFITPVIVFVLLDIFIYMASPYIDFYNVEFLHPLFWTLLPLTILLFLSSFLKNIKPKFVFTTIGIFCIADFVLLFQIDPVCSQIVCFDRNISALIFSSLFSLIYFIVLLVKNKKHIH